MTNRTPPPLPTSQPEQPAVAKPTTFEQIQKTAGSIATCIQGATKLAEFVEKHLGSGAAKPAVFPANMPALPGFPAHMPALPTDLAINPMQPGFTGLTMPDLGMGMSLPDMNQLMGGFPGFSNMGMGVDPNMMMGMGFDPNMMMGMGFDPNMMMGMGFDPNMMGMGFGQM